MRRGSHAVVEKSNDKIYYNVFIRNSSDTVPGLKAEFSEERVQSLLDKADDYYLTINRFSIPGNSIPIFIFQVQKDQNDVDLGIYSFTMSFVSDMDSILVNAANQTVPLSSGGAGLINTFVANGDTMTFGNASIYYRLNFTLDTPASRSIYGNANPTAMIEYSTGIGTWAVMDADLQAEVGFLDSTDGFVQDGFIQWDSDELTSLAVDPWVPGAGGEYLIRITRTNASAITTPIMNLVQLTAAFRNYIRYVTNAGDVLQYEDEWPPTGPVTAVSNQSSYYWVFSYSDMIDMMNTTIQSCYDDLVAAYPAAAAYDAAAGVSPFVEYFPSTPVRLITPRLWSTAGAPTLSFNEYLEPFLTGFRVIYNVKSQSNVNVMGLDETFRVINTKDNGYTPSEYATAVPPNWLKFDQDWNSLSLWSSFKSLVFTSESLPIVPEYITQQSDDGSVRFLPILTDFFPLVESPGDQRSLFLYTTSGPYRLTNLNSDLPLRKFSVAIYWADDNENLYPLYIRRGQQMSVKFLFVKKSTFTS